VCSRPSPHGLAPWAFEANPINQTSLSDTGALERMRASRRAQSGGRSTRLVLQRATLASCDAIFVAFEWLQYAHMYSARLVTCSATDWALTIAGRRLRPTATSLGHALYIASFINPQSPSPLTTRWLFLFSFRPRRSPSLCCLSGVQDILVMPSSSRSGLTAFNLELSS
jgi:hypothetical protein